MLLLSTYAAVTDDNAVICLSNMPVGLQLPCIFKKLYLFA